MALAKYYEENYEKVIERLDALEEKKRNPEPPLPVFQTQMCLDYTGFAQMVKAAETEARERSREGEYRVCSCCGRFFYFSEEEKRLYKARGFCKPKRCKACRKRSREQGLNKARVMS